MQIKMRTGKKKKKKKCGAVPIALKDKGQEDVSGEVWRAVQT